MKSQFINNLIQQQRSNGLLYDHNGGVMRHPLTNLPMVSAPQWEISVSLRSYYLATEQLAVREQLQAGLNAARVALDVRSDWLWLARVHHSDNSPLVAQKELDVCAALDTLWDAQNALRVWDETYGPHAVGAASR